MTIVAFQFTDAIDLQIQTQAATLDELTRELPAGFYTTFTTLSGGSRVLGLHAHLQRLYEPAIEQGIAPSINELALRTRITEYAKPNLPKESRIRLILAKNNGMIYIGIQRFEPLSRAIYEKGVKVVLSEMKRQSPRTKDTGFISSSVKERKKIGNDTFEVLLINRGRILEGMTSNFYAIKDRTLITAQRGILLGVTRRVILSLARGQGMSIEYRSPQVNEKFDEAFLTSSSRGVVPIVSIGNKSVGQGRVGRFTRQLSRAYENYVLAKAEPIS